MRRGSRVLSAIRRFGSCTLLLGLVAGCEPSSPLARSGIELQLPSAWRAVPAGTWPVAGVPLAAWSGPAGASLVVYRALPIPGGDAERLADALTNRLTNLPGLKVVARGTETCAGVAAARVEVVAPGTGDTLAASGTGVPLAENGRSLVPTRRVVVGFARPSRTIFLCWHAPESAADALKNQIRETLDHLQLGADRVVSSSY
jgi:hypothetical protein